MVEVDKSLASIAATGLRAQVDWRLHVGSLRYFDSDSSFGPVIANALGVELPGVLKASPVPGEGGGDLVAWRSPTEALVICASGSRFHAIQALCTGRRDGCFVDQTGGLCVIRASGERMSDLFSRLCGSALLPAPGEAKRGRLADVPALALSVSDSEMLFVTERMYLEHLMDWIRSTATDFE
jgi:sarcosine oxidase gamma subunit